MKIQRFNESLENIKECWICVIWQHHDYINSCVSDTKLDMEMWLLNHINEEVITQTMDYGMPEGIVYNEDKEPIFIDLVKAMDWYQDFFDYDVNYEQSIYIKNESFLYGVELARITNKYNI